VFECACSNGQTQLPLNRISLSAQRLHPKMNSLLIQSNNVEKTLVDVGVMTSETVFKSWDKDKSQWMTGRSQVQSQCTQHVSCQVAVDDRQISGV